MVIVVAGWKHICVANTWLIPTKTREDTADVNRSVLYHHSHNQCTTFLLHHWVIYCSLSRARQLYRVSIFSVWRVESRAVYRTVDWRALEASMLHSQKCWPPFILLSVYLTEVVHFFVHKGDEWMLAIGIGDRTWLLACQWTRTTSVKSKSFIQTCCGV